MKKYLIPCLLALWLVVGATAPVMAQTVNRTLNLQWTANTDTDLAGYKVYRGNLTCDQAGPLLPFATIPMGPNIAGSYTDATVPSTWFEVCYWVTAYDTSGLESGKSIPAGKTFYVAPSVVTSVAFASITPTAFSASWTAVGDGTGRNAKYDVRYAVAPALTNGGWATAKVAACGLATNTSCTVTGLLPNTSYELQIMAYRTDATGANTYGPVSTVFATKTLIDTVPPAIPQNLRVTEVPTVGSVILEWDLPEGVQPVSNRIDRFTANKWVLAKETLGEERQAQVTLANTGRRLFRVCSSYPHDDLCNTKVGVWVSR